MGLRRFHNKRDLSEAAIVETLRAAGCSVYPLDKPGDLLVGYLGVTHLLECKTGKGKLTETQEKFQREWRGDYWIIRTVEEAIEVLNLWARKAAA